MSTGGALEPAKVGRHGTGEDPLAAPSTRSKRSVGIECCRDDRHHRTLRRGSLGQPGALEHWPLQERHVQMGQSIVAGRLDGLFAVLDPCSWWRTRVLQAPN